MKVGITPMALTATLLSAVSSLDAPAKPASGLFAVTARSGGAAETAAEPVAATSAPAPAQQVIPSVHMALVTPDSLRLVWRFKIQKEWYLYAPYRNDTGFAPSVALTLPEGWTAGPLHFPAPERKVLPGGILDHVYHCELLVTQTITTGGVPEPAGNSETPGGMAANMSARLFWLACRELCVPGQAALDLALDTGADAVPDSQGAELWERAQRNRPAQLADGTVHVERDGQTITLTVPGARDLTFIPAESGPLLANLLHDGVSESDSLILRLRPGPDGHVPLGGLLSINYENGRNLTGVITIP